MIEVELMSDEDLKYVLKQIEEELLERAIDRKSKLEAI